MSRPTTVVIIGVRLDIIHILLDCSYLSVVVGLPIGIVNSTKTSLILVIFVGRLRAPGGVAFPNVWASVSLRRALRLEHACLFLCFFLFVLYPGCIYDLNRRVCICFFPRCI